MKFVVLQDGIIWLLHCVDFFPKLLTKIPQRKPCLIGPNFYVSHIFLNVDNEGLVLISFFDILL